MARGLNLIGQTFGRVTVLASAGSRGSKRAWLTRCSCGTEKVLVGAEMRRGNVQSCGCLQKEMASAQAHRHGLSYHPAYAVYRSMVDRCHLPTHRAWPRYGARGIAVCPAWRRSFSAFWNDMGPSYRPGLTIERLDNDAGYSPANCAWRNRTHQARNTRKNVTVETPQGPMLLCEAAEVSGINFTTLSYRFHAGWPASRMFDPPDFTNRVV